MYKLIQWLNVEDKVLNDKTKFVTIHERVSEPSTVGLDPDLEYFLYHEPYSYPSDADARLVTINTVYTMTDNIVDGYRTLEITYEIEERTAEEIKVSIEDEEVVNNAQLITNTKQLKYLALYAVITNRRVQGLTITNQMLELEALVEAKALKIWNNHILSLTKQAAVDSGDPLELDEGWENA